ncbi:nucleoside triphosphate pyrophosphohydrolase [Alicyclobacillus cycloheptanicus]|uniref:House-cleaning noncanonical NTP pyrophosphatase (MazG superfamily) n=1 Tax=Alicyclobacillus cycloheptanicus TaxID=1457 RepID=A0ABT9XD73_9BACL|nr:nucleoside triphosphate pyrophosphohydrolase [Alicyclobacillus cycloheptanicus]MDQ0188220.1 putative house-cleaning noncanonical NTP pyrophosphatase (MazG superfamily) [Alicyclobacillus cycloheptanicus]WDM00950.1 nucleoside triphosphate pyrophosphohydrolase [Alicyclobacillus cycloheptanicus]
MDFDPMNRNGDGPGRPKSPVTSYHRLVRDRIPEIIESMGNIAIWRELDGDAFAQALLDTVVRASEQFAGTESLESLADVLECIDAWLDVRGLTMEDVSRARAERRKRCGGYERRRFLEQVAHGADNEHWRYKDRSC